MDAQALQPARFFAVTYRRLPDEFLALVVDEQDGEDLIIDEALCYLRDPVEQLIQIQNGGQLHADLAQQPHCLEIALELVFCLHLLRDVPQDAGNPLDAPLTVQDRRHRELESARHITRHMSHLQALHDFPREYPPMDVFQRTG